MTTEKIRVLEVIDDASVGGGQMHVFLLAKYLDASIFDVAIATEPLGFLADKAKEINVPVFPVYMSNNIRYSSLSGPRRLLQDHQFDIIHTHGGTAGFWGRLSAVVNGNPAVRIHTYHGLHYLNQSGVSSTLFRMVDRCLLPVTTKVICVCQSDLRKGIEAKVVTQDKSMVIHNGIVTEKYGNTSARNELRDSLGLGHNDLVFISIGRLHIQKGYRDMLHAFQLIARRYNNSRLVIVGDGELHGELRHLVDQLQLFNHVIFLGSRNDIPELLPSADVFVLASLWEGQPIALLEAMASGLAVIATNVDGIPEIVEHERDGLLVNAGNVEELAGAMERLAVNAELRQQLSSKAKIRIVRDFSASFMAQRIGEVYCRSVDR